MIAAIKGGSFPAQAMLNFHPQRWMDPYLPWLKEKYTQTFKNQIKYYLIQWRTSR